MNNPIAVLAVSASVLAGAAGGATLFTPHLVGAHEDVTTTSDTTSPGRVDREDARSARILEELAGLVDDGTITQAQAEAVADTLAAAAADHRPRGGHGLGQARGRHGGLGVAGAAVAEALGVTLDELRGALGRGSTLAEVAAEQGVAAQVVVDAIVAEIGEHLDDAVAAGRLTEAEAAERRAAAAERAAAIVDGTHRHGHPRHHGGRPGDDPSGTTDTTQA